MMDKKLSLNKQNITNILYSAFSLLTCVMLGKLLAYFFPVLPASLYGLILFALTLHFKIFNAEKIKATVTWSIKNMGVCFVPAGVGIINHGELIKQFGVAIFLITLITTFVLLTIVALLYQHLEDKKLT